MKPGYRKAILLLLLAGVGVLAWFAPPPADQRAPSRTTAQKGKGESVAQPARAPSASSKPAERDIAISTTLPERAALGATKQDIFGSQSWQPPPPKAAPPPPPPPPVPPPNPFRFAGRWVQDGQAQVYLTKGDVPVPVKVGEVLDHVYRVDAIGNDNVAMTYLPLNHKETVVLGAPGDAGGGALPIPKGALVFAPAQQLSQTGVPPPPVPFAPALPPRDGSEPAVVGKPAADARRARVAWQGPQQVKLGAPFSLALRVTTDQPISGSPLQVRFDPAVLESVAVRPGRLYGADARGFNYKVGADGSIVVGSAGANSPATGDLELLVLTFKPLKPGATAEVSLATLNLQGQAGRVLAHDPLAAYRAPVMP